jgi:hypothetical protein
MPLVRNLLTKFGLQTDGGKLQRWDRGVAASKNRMKAAAAQARRFRAGLNDLALGFQFAYEKVRQFVEGLTTGYSVALDKQAKFASATGINIEFLQGLSHAAGLTGGGMESVLKVTSKLVSSMDMAREGARMQKDAFRDLGGSLTDNEGKLKGIDTVMLELFDSLKKIENPTERAALANRLLGKQWQAILPLVLQGSAGIKKMTREAKELGIVMSAKAARQAEEFNDQLLRAKSAAKGLRNAISREILPPLTALFKRFQLWFRTGNNAARLLNWVKIAAKAAGAAMAALVTGQVIGGVKSLVGGLKAGIAAVRALGLAGALAQAKLLLIPAALAAVAALVFDLWRFMSGRKSLIGEYLGDSQDAAVLKVVLLDLVAAAKEAWTTLRPALIELTKAMKPLLKEIWAILKPLIPVMLFWMRIALQITTVLVKQLSKEIAGIIKAIADTIRTIRAFGKAVADFFRNLTRTVVNEWNNAVSTIVRVVDKVKQAWADVVSGARKMWTDLVSWISAQIDLLLQKAKSVLLALTGGKELKVTGVAPTEETFRPTPATTKAPKSALQQIGAGRHTTIHSKRSASIGSLTVNVTGSTNMQAPEIQAAVKTGAKDVLDGLIGDLFRDVKEA